MVHEWPGRSVGILVSIGTGKMAPPSPDSTSAVRQLVCKESGSMLQGSFLGNLLMQSKSMKLRCSVMKTFIKSCWRKLNEPVLGRKTTFA